MLFFSQKDCDNYTGRIILKNSNPNTENAIRVNGIVAEYNPFHNGHLYQLQDAGRQTGADYTVVVMSGNFMQRGTPALLDKFSRTKMALENGADLVLELPTLYATSSAEYFATGAVTLLDKLGVVNYLCFGSECGDVHRLEELADILLEEPEEYSVLLKKYLKQGLSYPNARTAALMQFRPDLSDARDVLASANNILGIAYLKAIKRRKSGMKPITTARTSSDYHDRMLGVHQSSALALRQSIYEKRDLQILASQMPESAFEILRDALSGGEPMQLNDLSSALLYRLLTEADKGYVRYLDVSEDLSARILNHLCDFKDYQTFCDLLKTKDMTYTRISRCLLHILLDIRDTDLTRYRQADHICYARVLGFRREAEGLLSAIKQRSCIPLVTKLADAEQVLDAAGQSILQKELRMNSIYEGIAAVKYRRSMVNEYRSPLVIL